MKRSDTQAIIIGLLPSNMMAHFAHAVLLVNSRYVLQLRDNKPGIPSPGMWSLFGGRIEEGEEPQAAMLREIEEELCVRLPDCHFLWSVDRYNSFYCAEVTYIYFEADFTALWGRQYLTEGQAAEHFAYEELSKLKIPPLIRDVLERHYHERFLRSKATES